MQIDGRTIGDGRRGALTARLQELFAQAREREADAGRVEIADR